MEAFAIEWTEWSVHKLFFWEADPIRKGKILRGLHHFFMNSLAVLIVVSHTIYPAFWLQTLLLGVCLSIWVQHITTNGCVISKVEQKLIGDEHSFVDPFIELFHVKPTQELAIAVVVMGSTLATFLLSLEWIARVHHKLIPIVTALLTKAISLTGKTE